jgi:hypothetical protein
MRCLRILRLAGVGGRLFRRSRADASLIMGALILIVAPARGDQSLFSVATGGARI